MVREYILHDRGNSLFLGDSFANLPSPVNDSQSIKKLFKPSEEELKQVVKKPGAEDESKKVIKIEGKGEISGLDDSDKKQIVDINVDDIEQHVFRDRSTLKEKHQDYEEEDSYMNP
jgi:hypothetical protein